MITVYEFQFQELYDFNTFSCEYEANEYKLKRLRENEKFYESDMSKYVHGLNIVIIA